MKISIMGGWKSDSGASLHSESLGREFVDMGHELNVFTFYHHAFHGSQLTGKDEDYVKACFTHGCYNPLELDPRPFLTSDYNYFIAEDIGMFPKDLLIKIYNSHIKKKAKCISVYHDNCLTDDPSFYQFDWDAIVCFDERFKKVLDQVYPNDLIHIIPYPCHPWTSGDKKEAREFLNLPEDKKIIFTFGGNTNRVLKVMEGINGVCDDYSVALLALTKDRVTIDLYEELGKKLNCELIIREEAPSINRLYKYLHASDLLLYYRKPIPHIVVASTILQCLGAGCAILGNKTRYTEMFDNEIFKYDNEKELQAGIREIFNQTDKHLSVIESAKKYVINNSCRNISQKFIDLYKKL